MNQSIHTDILQVMPIAVGSGLFVSLCTIQEPSSVQGPTGNFANTWSDVSGLVNIVCMDAPQSIMTKISAGEQKNIGQILSEGMRHVLLGQCFLDAKTWSGLGYRAIIDGVAYDLLGAENDSQSTQTRIDLQLVTV